MKMQILFLFVLSILTGCYTPVPNEREIVTQQVSPACDPTPLATLTERSSYLNVFPSRDGVGEPFQYLVLNIETNVPVEFAARESHSGVYVPVVYINNVRQGSLVYNGRAFGLWLFNEIGENSCFRFSQLTVGLGVPPQTIEYGRLLFDGATVIVRVDLCENRPDGRCFHGETRIFSVVTR